MISYPPRYAPTSSRFHSLWEADVKSALSPKPNRYVISFEELASLACNDDAPGNYLAGGYTGNGLGPGPNCGISVSGDALLTKYFPAGGSGYFTPTGSGYGETGSLEYSGIVAFYLDGTGWDYNTATINIEHGFDTYLAGLYSAIYPNGDQVKIEVFSELDGGGTALASVSPGVSPALGDPLYPHPNCIYWLVPFGPMYFDGVAKSIKVTGPRGQVIFDHFDLGNHLLET